MDTEGSLGCSGSAPADFVAVAAAACSRARRAWDSAAATEAFARWRSNSPMAGRALPLLNAAPGSVTAQIPYDLPVNTRYQLVLQHGAAIAASPQEITIAVAQPAIFTSDRSGAGQGLIYKIVPGSDPALADSSNPLQPGDHVLIRCTGLGAVTPSLAEGVAAPSSPPATVNPVTLTIGGVNTPVDFAGLITELAGIYQVQATVPDGVPSGPVAFLLTAAGQNSNPVSAFIQ